jgi:hypothetical protein
MRIVIRLPMSRLRSGTLHLIGDDGVELLCGDALGRADNMAAAKAGNPSRNPLKSYGDTPVGQYLGALLAGCLQPARSYGTFPPISLNPMSGQALQAKLNGRRGLLLHSGDLGLQGGLRPTHGCVRIHPATHQALVEALSANKQSAVPVLIEESEDRR